MAHFEPGTAVTWFSVPRGGYGFVWPVDGVVVRRTGTRVIIRVATRNGEPPRAGGTAGVAAGAAGAGGEGTMTEEERTRIVALIAQRFWTWPEYSRRVAMRDVADGVDVQHGAHRERVHVPPDQVGYIVREAWEQSLGEG